MRQRQLPLPAVQTPLTVAASAERARTSWTPSNETTSAHVSQCPIVSANARVMSQSAQRVPIGSSGCSHCSRCGATLNVSEAFSDPSDDQGVRCPNNPVRAVDSSDHQLRCSKSEPPDERSVDDLQPHQREVDEVRPGHHSIRRVDRPQVARRRSRRENVCARHRPAKAGLVADRPQHLTKIEAQRPILSLRADSNSSWHGCTLSQSQIDRYRRRSECPIWSGKASDNAHRSANKTLRHSKRVKTSRNPCETHGASHPKHHRCPAVTPISLTPHQGVLAK